MFVLKLKPSSFTDETLEKCLQSIKKYVAEATNGEVEVASQSDI